MVLHPEAQALLSKYADAGALPLHKMGVINVREAVRKSRKHAGDREDVASVLDLEIPSAAGRLPARVYHPDPSAKLPLLVYFHGGGWISGSVDVSDRPCRQLANTARCVVASVEYRLSPETQCPAALDDAYVATCWFAGHRVELGARSDALIIAGDSAGGTIAASTTLMLRDRSGPPATAQVLLYPALSPDFGGISGDRTAGTEFGLSRADMDFFWGSYLSNPVEPDRYAAPLLALDLTGLPPTLLITAEHDVLRDEGKAYAKRLGQAGVAVTTIDAVGMIHGFFGQFGAVPSARQYLEVIARFLR